MERTDIALQVLIIRDLEKHGVPHKKAEEALIRHCGLIRIILNHMSNHDLLEKKEKLERRLS